MEHRIITIADQVFDELEQAILSGEYARGDVLTELKLSERLGVSRTPIREALRRLEQEHIIESTSKGAKVIGITMDDIADIREIRLRLEGLASRWAAERADDESIAGLREALDLQELYTQKNDADNLKNADTRFHQTIYILCGSNAIRETLEPLHRKLLKYRKVSLGMPLRALRSLAEHKAIADAIAAHNGPEAERLTILHVRNAHDAIAQRGDDA